MKLCVITVYFGEYPQIMPLWQHCCSRSKNVSFFVVGDRPLPAEYPNVIRVPMTLGEFRRRAEEALKTKAVLSDPYKCCDYKPLFGFILKELAAGFDYWGFCDVDLLMGDIEGFARRCRLQDYDKFLSLGHFSLIKNSPRVFAALTDPKSPFYKKMLSVPETIQFDEKPGGANDLLAEAGMKVFDERVFADISKNWKRIKFSERFADSRNVNAPRQLFFWQKGRVFRYWLQGEGIKSEEHLYIHFRKRNYQMPPRLPGEDDAVIVAPGSLLVKKLPDGGPDRQTVCSLNPYRGRLFEAIECKTLCHIPGYIKK